MTKPNDETMCYEISGRKYVFKDVRIKLGIPYGYNERKRGWAWLFPKYIQFEGENPVVAKRIS